MVGKQRNFGLDVTRAISILFVLAAHKYDLPVELGIVGVQIFFVLSGFLIGQILIKNFSGPADLSTVIGFWKRRWFRTLPLYYLILIVKIWFFGNPYGWKMIVYFLFLQANILGIDFFGVSWSLVVEEWFYIFLPLAAFLFFRKGIEARKFLVFLISFILLFFTVRFLWNFYYKGIIIYQFDCLLLGVLLSLFKLRYSDFYAKLNSAFLFFTGIGAIVLLTVMLGKISDVPLYNTFYRVVWYLLISIAIALTIPWIEQSRFLNDSVKKSKSLYFFFTWTSILTYSIYLIHMDVFHISFHTTYFIQEILQFIILYMISFAIYALYEHPVMTLRDNFSLKQYVDSVRSVSLKN